jgi:hypothetical protein
MPTRRLTAPRHEAFKALAPDGANPDYQRSARTWTGVGSQVGSRDRQGPRRPRARSGSAAKVAASGSAQPVGGGVDGKACVLHAKRRARYRARMLTKRGSE